MTNFNNNSTVKSIIIILIITALVLIPAVTVFADDGLGSEPSGSSSSCPGGSDGGSSNASAGSSSASSSGAASSSGSSSTSSGSTAGSSSASNASSSSSGSTGSGSSMGSTSSSAGSFGSTDSSGSSGSSDTANSAGSDSTAGSSSSGSSEQDSGATGSDSSTISAETSAPAGSGNATGSEDFTVSSSSASDSGSDNISADPETESPNSSADDSSPDNPGSDPVISEQDSIQHEDSADHKALSTETGTPETGDSGDDSSTTGEAKQGNSYVATLKSDGEPLHAATPKEFTITFTEVGTDQIGSAQVDVPVRWTLNNVSTVVASNGHSWIHSTSGNEITITAGDPTQLVGFGESVAVTFTATVADASHNEVYEFATLAWTDTGRTPGNENNMAAGYSDPVFIVGTGVGARAELEAIATDATTLNGIYVLTANIDLSSAPWTPLGDDSAPFTGAFHGAGSTISGLEVSHGADNAGLFGVTNGAILHHVWLVDVGMVETSSGNNVGAIAGQMRNSSQLINSYAAGDFEVYGEENVGGLVGLLSGSTIVNSYSTLAVAVFVTDAGGLVGSAETDSIISDSYARGDVDGESGNAGGLVGNLNTNSVVWRSYSTGAVSGGTGTTGGLVGTLNSASVYGSFYDSQTSGQSDDDDRGHPGTTVELQTLSHYTGYTRPWTMAGYNGAYPVLYWQAESGLNSSSSIWYMPGGPGGPTPPGLIPIHGGGGYNNSDPRWSPCTTFSSSAYTKSGYDRHRYLKLFAEADKELRALPPTGETSPRLWVALIWLTAGCVVLSFSKRAAVSGTV